MKTTSKWVWSLILLQLGVLSYVIAIKAFYIPNHLLSGGVTGIALLLHLLFNWPVGFLTFLFNIPIFLIGIRDVGKKFAVISALGVVAFWLVVDHVPIPPATHDHLLAAIFGGLLGGLATALALKAGGSLGGFDILGVVLNRRFSLGVGEASLILNGALISAAGLIENFELAMYTLVAIYVAGRSLDAIQLPRPRKAVLVFSKKNHTIKARILAEMGRGVSLFKTMGAYSGEEYEALLCVVTRYELREMRDIIRSADPEAFVSVLEASDVMGRFQRPSAFEQIALKRSRK
jgi:uncharacterized membrane-anchored protein YitT (DUF2179 family)